MPQVDPELFDRGQFQAELALKSTPIRRSARTNTAQKRTKTGRSRIEPNR